MIIEMDSFLPPLYEMDDYSTCLDNMENQYCSISARLDFSKQPSFLKNIVQNITMDKFKFDRYLIHRALCIPKINNVTKNFSYIYSTKKINEELIDYDATVIPEDITCIRNIYEVTKFDQIIMFLLLLYSLSVAYVTLDEFALKKKNRQPRGIRIFSLLNLWKERTKGSNNIDYQKLLSMQGLRFVSIIILFYTHLFFMYNLSYLSNPPTYEKLIMQPHSIVLSFLSVFIVLIFFILSSWLLTVQVHNIFEKYGKFSIKHIGIIILNRYFRMIPTVIFSIILIKTSLMKLMVGPSNFFLIIRNENSCRINWIQSLLFTSNFNHIFDICNPVSWYLSADFQLYIVNVLILYAKFKFKINETRLYTILMATACIIHGILLHIYDVNVIFKPYLRNLEMQNLSKSTEYLVSYMSTISIWSTSLVGLIVGSIYHKNKNTHLQINRLTKALWILCFFGLPTLAVVLINTEFKEVSSVFVGVLVKPLFAVGIALGILGMSHGFGGMVKKFLENKYIVLLSNFTYSIYLLHTGVINTLYSNHNNPITISWLSILNDYTASVIQSFALGILITLIIEEPGLIMQKKYLPQITKWDQKSGTSKKEYNNH